MNSYLPTLCKRVCTLLSAILLFALPHISEAQTIGTVVGNGTAGFSGDNGSATNASLNNPSGIAIDASGNIYIADQNNHRVRKVDTNGVITTVAGYGFSGYTGDGGPATSTKLSFPSGVFVDKSGNLYIADTGNNRIRKVNTSGIISTVAGNGTLGFAGDGGPATSARLYAPTDVAVSASGNIYIADRDNNRVRKVSTSGIITTVAGNGYYPGQQNNPPKNDPPMAINTALFKPVGLFLDSLENLYIAVYGNHQIFKVPPDGTIQPVAGVLGGSFSGDGGIATKANLSFPSGVTQAPNGTLFIADQFNHRIRTVGTNGIISTLAGNGTHSFSGDGGVAKEATLNYPTDVALDTLGNLYIADRVNNRIRKISAPTITLSTPICRQSDSFEVFYTSTIFQPNGYTITGTGVNPIQMDTVYGSTGSIRVSIDPNTFTGNFTLVLSNSNTGYSTVPVNGSVSAIAGPTSYSVVGGDSFCAGDSTGAIGLASSQTGVNYQLLGSGGVVGTPVAGTGSSISLGSVTQADTYKVIATDVGTGCQSTMSGLAKIEQAPTVTLSKSDDLSNTVPLVTLTATPSDQRVYTYVFSGPGVVSQNPNSPTATVNKPGSYTVKAFPSPGCFTTAMVYVEQARIITTVAGNGTFGFSGDGGPANAAKLQSPYGVAVDSTGNIYIADQYNHRIRKVDKNGIISTVAGNGSNGFGGDNGVATSASLSAPADVAVDAAGNLFIADRDNHRIRKVNTNGLISTVAGNGTSGSRGDGGNATNASLSFPNSVKVDPAGNLYIADRDNHRVRKVDTDGIINTVAGNGNAAFSGDGGIATNASLNLPNAVELDDSGNLYIADRYNQRIRMVNPAGIIGTVAGNGYYGGSGDGGLATNANLNSPTDLALDASGNLLIADGGNYRIRRVNANGIISTIAGIGAYGFSGDNGPATKARLSFPSGIASDQEGNIYIADTDNHRIRKVIAFPSITLDNLSAICREVTSFTMAYTSTTGNPDQYIVSGAGITSNQTGPLPVAPGSITLSIDPSTFVGDFSIVVTNSSTGISSNPINVKISFVSKCPIISIKTGNWEDPDTWNLGRVPIADDYVILEQGHHVTINDLATAQSIEFKQNAKLIYGSTSVTLSLSQ